MPETGLQGQVPPGDPTHLTQGYRCNLEVVSKYAEDGFLVSLAWYRNCAYVDTGYRHDDPQQAELSGVRVIDASDGRHPRRTALLQTPAMRYPLESLQVNQQRGLLAAVQANAAYVPVPGGPKLFVPGGPHFDLYDVRSDCAHPRLLASVPLFDALASPHAGGFSPDGRTYYAVGTPNRDPGTPWSMIAIDLSVASRPRVLHVWNRGNQLAPGRRVDAHQVEFGPDGRGMLAYLPQKGNSVAPSGLVIADVSAIQQRAPRPEVRVVGQVAWADSLIAMSSPVGRIGNRTYAFVADEAGSASSSAQACSNGTPPSGFVHVVDVTNPAKPRQVSSVRLETSDPANCSQTRFHPEAGGVAWSPHFCSVDDPRRVTALACGWQQSGLRVFDVRNPLKPREIAYYNPAPQPHVLRGSLALKPFLYPSPFRDSTPSAVRWHRAAGGQWQLWVMSEQNGFQIVRFTNGVYPLRPYR